MKELERLQFISYSYVQKIMNNLSSAVITINSIFDFCAAFK